MAEDTRTPLLEHEPSETPVFTAENLLEAARIRKGLPKVSVPAGCLLDFDGELVQHLAATGKAAEDSAWRRGDEQPLPASRPVCRCRPLADRRGPEAHGRVIRPGTYRPVLDHRRTFPGDGEPHRFEAPRRDRLRGNGGSGAPGAREGPEQTSCVPCPCDEHDGNPGGGFRERRRRGTCGFPFRLRRGP